MFTQVQLSVRPATAEDHQKLANLIHFETYVHRHLDWRAPLDWIGEQPYLVAEQRGNLVAALACPPDPPKVGWLRLFAASGGIGPERSWKALWPEARQMLAGSPGIDWAAAIPLQHWFQSLLDKSGFVQTHNVVMLSWDPSNFQPKPEEPAKAIRPMNYDDLPAVETIDTAAFHPVWQNSLACLEVAFRQAAVATVAEEDGRLVGYQISTATPMGGHLARLAVLPGVQGQGVGHALVIDLLHQFIRRGAMNVTVNTQHDNQASLALYQKVGFQLTGEKYPIYQLNPHAEE